MSELTEEQKIARGEYLAEVFGLRRDREHADRFATSVGSKTALGIFAVSERILNEPAPSEVEAAAPKG